MVQTVKKFWPIWLSAPGIVVVKNVTRPSSSGPRTEMIPFQHSVIKSRKPSLVVQSVRMPATSAATAMATMPKGLRPKAAAKAPTELVSSLTVETTCHVTNAAPMAVMMGRMTGKLSAKNWIAG